MCVLMQCFLIYKHENDIWSKPHSESHYDRDGISFLFAGKGMKNWCLNLSLTSSSKALSLGKGGQARIAGKPKGQLDKQHNVRVPSPV